MLDSRTTKAIEDEKLRKWSLSFLRVFLPTRFLSPLSVTFSYYDLGKSNVVYRDIYVFGYRIIRYQLRS